MASEVDLNKLLRRVPFPILVIGVILLIVVYLVTSGFFHRDENPSPGAPEDGYLLCFWNVENFFDDRDDKLSKEDEKYDNLFANDPELLREKLGNLSKVLLAMNGGRGPDILAIAECESERAAELLQQRLNDDLPEGVEKYREPFFVEQKAGRHIAPAILTRLKGSRKKQLGERHHRILEVHIEAEGKDLVLIAAHWKSRVKSPGSHTSDEEGRAKYADVIYGRFKEMYLSNPNVDVLICGDFNDDPDDKSVIDHLHAIGDRDALTAGGGDPMLFNLTAGLDREKYGTHWHSPRWHLFDQIVVSPGLLDAQGWTCDPATFRTEREHMSNHRGRPWRFEDDESGHHAGKGSHGFSDHFPVSVRLKVHE